MKVIKIHPYKMGSHAAKFLAEALSKELGYYCYRVSHEYVPKENEVIVNWGAGWACNANNTKNIINPHNKLRLCIDKVEFFRHLVGKCRLPEFTTDKYTAKQWAANGEPVYCRTHTEGMDGAGIVIADDPDTVVDARLFTKALPSTQEWRIHVVGNVVIPLLKSHKKPTIKNQMIRTGGNGWFYIRDVAAPLEVVAQARKAAKALGMDFVAVDCLYDEPSDMATILEANSAPELGPYTAPIYAKELRRMVGV